MHLWCQLMIYIYDVTIQQFIYEVCSDCVQLSKSPGPYKLMHLVTFKWWYHTLNVCIGNICQSSVGWVNEIKSGYESEQRCHDSLQRVKRLHRLKAHSAKTWQDVWLKHRSCSELFSSWRIDDSLILMHLKTQKRCTMAHAVELRLVLH